VAFDEPQIGQRRVRISPADAHPTPGVPAHPADAGAGAPATPKVAPRPLERPEAGRSNVSRVAIVAVTIAVLRGIVALGRLSADPVPDIQDDIVRFREITGEMAALQRQADARPARALDRADGPADSTVTISQADASVRRLCRERSGPVCVVARSVLEDLQERYNCPEARDRIVSLLDAPGKAGNPALEAAIHDLRGVSARVCGAER
jgi:hypothetical protein